MTQPERTVPVTGSYDVIVAGGGIAGVSAALAAARCGACVCLLEKTCSLGGLATLGNIIIWLPLCDGRGRQVIAGLGEELLKASVADLGQDHPEAHMKGIPSCWQSDGGAQERIEKRYIAEFNPAGYLLALEKILCRAGVTLLYDTLLCDVTRREDRIEYILTESKAGRRALRGRTFIDATGDADICLRAGEQTESLETNALSAWYYQWRSTGLVLRRPMKPFSPTGGREGAEGPFFSAESPEEITAFMLASRRMVRDDLEAVRRENPGDFVEPVMVQTIPGLRMTRRLVGDFSLSDRDVHRWFEDAIGLTGDWRKAGPVYAIPYRTLTGVVNRNLLAVGRCMSSDRTAWDVTRVIPPCALTGAAAGTAAAMACSETGADVRSLPVSRLQDRLRKQGELIDRRLVEPVGS